VKRDVRTVILVLIGAVALIVAGWIVTLVLFKAGERTNPPRPVPVTTVPG
jgi:uncharacterized membrane protein